MRRKTKLNRPTKRKRATNRASDAAPVVKINAADVVHVTAVDVGVALSDEQRSLLKRVLEKVLRVLYAFEGGIEVGPDGTIRVIGHLRS
jgi:hypothetical protein